MKLWKNLRLKNGLPNNTYTRKTSTYNYSNGTQLTAMVYANSEDKSQVIQETSLLTPKNRNDSAKSSRASTLSNNDRRAPQGDGMGTSLIGNNSSSHVQDNET